MLFVVIGQQIENFIRNSGALLASSCGHFKILSWGIGTIWDSLTVFEHVSCVAEMLPEDPVHGGTSVPAAALGLGVWLKSLFMYRTHLIWAHQNWDKKGTLCYGWHSVRLFQYFILWLHECFTSYSLALVRSEGRKTKNRKYKSLLSSQVVVLICLSNLSIYEVIYVFSDRLTSCKW